MQRQSVLLPVCPHGVSQLSFSIDICVLVLKPFYAGASPMASRNGIQALHGATSLGISSIFTPLCCKCRASSRAEQSRISTSVA